ncbi:MAG: hypothetical protein WKF34_03260 [Pyrinomonadaceae bacterium]
MKFDGKFAKRLPKNFQMPSDAAGLLLLREYGAVFVVTKSVVPPSKVAFGDEADVLLFQSTMKVSSETIGGYRLELQAEAMKKLKSAIADAKKAGLSISPRGADSARRGFQQTVSLWASRVNPGLVYWTGKGKISRKEADHIRSLSPSEQVPEILRLEQQKIFFAKDLSKSIIYSVAPPGTSQHVSMLALDVKEFDDARVREILAKHGWFQTVVSDLPHFTFLGHDEDDLPDRGLKLTINSGRRFWTPDISGDTR